MRKPNQLAKGRIGVGLHPESLQVEHHGAFIEDPQHEAFPVDHRNDRHADIDFPAVHLELDAAVLRQTLFRDIEPRHDLQPADDGGLETVDFRRDRLRMEHPVDAVANLESRCLALDVHVAGSGMDGLEQQFVDQTDDRCFLRHLRQLRAVGFDLIEQFEIVFFAAQLQQAFDRFAANPQMVLSQPVDFAASRQDGDDRFARRRAHFVDRIEIERVARGDDQLPVLAPDRKDPLAVDQLRRKTVQQREVWLDFSEIDELQPCFLRQRLQGRYRVDDPQTRGFLDELRRIAGVPVELLELFSRQQSSLHEQTSRIHPLLFRLAFRCLSLTRPLILCYSPHGFPTNAECHTLPRVWPRGRCRWGNNPRVVHHTIGGCPEVDRSSVRPP